MKSALMLLGFFFTGILCGVSGLAPDILTHANVELGVLCILMSLVGIGIGSDPQTKDMIRQVKPRVLLVPLGVVVGSLLGAGTFSLFVSGLGLREALAIGAGFGYYSLSSVLITQIRGAELGVIALLSNILRELTTLVFAPWYVRVFGNLAPIASGGATTTDVTLPVIQKFSGNQYVMVALINGIVLSFIVPFLIPLLLY